MKVLVFSDVHGNLPALEMVLKKEPDVEGYINLGDVVNYGPWSNECVDLIDSLDNCLNITGNHEDYFKLGACDVKSSLVQDFFKKTFLEFNRQKIIEKYNKKLFFEGFNLAHTLDDKKYVFRDTEVNIKENLLLGHSHQQYLRLVNNKMLINPGSIGQNRKLINVSNYLIWNIETGEFNLKSTTYNFKYFIDKMKIEKYPKNCIEYYENKKLY